MTTALNSSHRLLVPNPLSLGDLLEGLDDIAVRGDEELSILGLSYDSRRVSPGSAFVAIRGAAFDGHQFIQQALAKGAVAIVAEQPPPPATAATWIEVRDSRVALAKLAANFYRQPTQSLQVIGITGTNGKTT
ncbi:MAG TPA: hypothetical protein DCE18_01620, partial [Syntrophobacteraceae bacterium]|nr:hypothetical protein [Syntrophobacteraceae bacterium]